MRVLEGGLIYDSNDIIQVTSDPQYNPTGAESRTIVLFDHSHTPLPDTYGDDYIAGGEDDDVIFGQLGDDVIQGDGAMVDDVVDEQGDVVANPAATPDVYAQRLPDGTLDLNASFELADGTDIDDPDANDLGRRNDIIFGGAGTDVARNDLGDSDIVNGNVIVAENGHSRDADMILGDNGNIFRLVGTNGTDGGAFLTFKYDNYGSLKLIPRAAELLDYTVGGPDYLPTAAQSADDIGAVDEIHGESGVLGDDGRIYTSRNSKDYGEPLYGIAAIPAGELNQFISTPGKIQRATINVSGALKKTVNLTPFKLGDPNDLDYAHDMFDPSYADDIIYGGWGGDFIHAGDGDDAVSGAEALAEFYDGPENLGSVLRFGEEKAGEFAAYDEYDPWRKILVDEDGVFTTEADPDAGEFLLNFDHEDLDGGGLMPLDTYGPDHDFEPVMTDGDDVIFGDLGNDWLVGGTGRDHLYGGYGSDLLNVDDNHDSTIDTGDPRANDIPDTHPSYEDLTYGGAGRDVLIGNTGGDRLIDWVGEFNSYIVPFAPFGMATVSRTLQPQLREFLYDLSASYGADPTRAADTGAEPERNGEPEGELGMVAQKDFDWKDQTGAPDDPQAGNIPGGKRDVLRSATFNAGNKEGFFADSGVWEVQDGALRVSAESIGGDAVSVYYVDEMLPSYFEIQASVTMEKPTGGWKANAYVIFDYYSPTDFKFAGINASIDKIQMGRRDETGWHVDVQTSMHLKPGRLYNLLVVVNGTNVTVIANNTEVFSHTFDARIIEGYAYGINAGMIGFGSDNSRGVYDNIAVQVLPPEMTLEATEEFPDTDTAVDLVPESGWWLYSGSGERYYGTAEAGGDTPVSLVDLGIDYGLEVTSILKLEVTLNTQDTAGVVFDHYDAEDFKFAVISVESDQLIIGHHTKRKGFVYDAVFDTVIEAGTDYVLNVSLKGTTVSASVKEAGSEYWQAIVGYVFNAVTVDGGFGLLVKGGTGSFDAVTVRTDDPAFREDQDPALMASGAPEVAVGAESILTYEELMPIVDEAIDRWSDSGLVDADDLSSLHEVTFQITDLSGLALGWTVGQTIMMDVNAAGYGWFVDLTPGDDNEFSDEDGDGLLVASTDTLASGRMDLLTVVMHEIGHVLGFEDLDAEEYPRDFMSATLAAGVRRLDIEVDQSIAAKTDYNLAIPLCNNEDPPLVEPADTLPLPIWPHTKRLGAVWHKKGVLF